MFLSGSHDLILGLLREVLLEGVPEAYKQGIPEIGIFPVDHLDGVVCVYVFGCVGCYTGEYRVESGEGCRGLCVEDS